MSPFKPTRNELKNYTHSGLGTINAYIDLGGKLISRGGKPARRSTLHHEVLRPRYEWERKAGQTQKLVSFLVKPNEKRGQQLKKNEQQRYIRSGVTPGILNKRGFAWGAKDLTRTVHNEVVWTMGKNAGGRTAFTHKYLPGYAPTNIPDHAYSSLAEVGKDLTEMADGARSEVVVYMPVVREHRSLLAYLLNILPLNKHWIIQAGKNKVNPTDPEPHFYTLTMQNRGDIAAELVKAASEIELENNSSGLVVGLAVTFEQIIIRPAPYNKHKNNHPQGAFWSHLFQPELHPEFVKVWGEFGNFRRRTTRTT
jgi:hypothetical protein